MAGIKLVEIKKSFFIDKVSVSVLNGINLTISEGEITVLLGKSGCGKTTLLRIIGGLEKYDSGKLDFSKDIKTAFVFQEPRLMAWLSVIENIKFGLRNKNVNNKIIQKYVNLIGLTGFEKAFPNQLSGGMQQRVSIARALAYMPDFIMMDEPFSSLDFFTRSQMQKELIQLQTSQNASILFVTHSIDEALVLADKIAIIENGKVKKEFNISFDKKNRNTMDEYLLNLKRQIMQCLDFNQ